MYFLILMILPTIICTVIFLFELKNITWKEFVIQNVINMFVIGFCLLIATTGKGHDKEIWNGRVLTKYSEKVSCRHSYSCNCYNDCYTDKDGEHCTEHCSTCYEHNYDIDWNVHTSLGDYEIDTIDSQGIKEPPRWTSVVIGEPVSMNKSFVNYVKMNPKSLFVDNVELEKYNKMIPNYPQLYDYWKINRFINLFPVANVNAWNTKLSEINRDLNPKKECNINIIAVPEISKDYFYALRNKWIGGKKNDIDVIISVKSDNSIAWVNSLCWTNSSIINVKLRDDIQSLNKFDCDSVTKIISDDVEQYYQRKHFRDFKYLQKAINLSTTEFVIITILSVIATIVASVFFIKNDFSDSSI